MKISFWDLWTACKSRSIFVGPNESSRGGQLPDAISRGLKARTCATSRSWFKKCQYSNFGFDEEVKAVYMFLRVR